MIERVFECLVAAPIEEVWEFHGSVEALRALTPPGRGLTLVGDDLAVRNGALHVLRFRQFGLSMEWRARISEVNPPRSFVDTAEKSPFAYWQHRHEFESVDGGTRIRDRLRYRPPGGPFARIVDALFVRRDLERLFAFRHAATRRALESR